MIKAINVREMKYVSTEQASVPMYHVYENPADLPFNYVLRLWDLHKPTPYFIGRDSYDEILKEIPKGAIKVDRTDSKESSAKEVWL